MNSPVRKRPRDQEAKQKEVVLQLADGPKLVVGCDILPNGPLKAASFIGRDIELDNQDLALVRKAIAFLKNPGWQLSPTAVQNP